jgi:sigma-B regulation protein RsbU (phosphoserine phosphatase)
MIYAAKTKKQKKIMTFQYLYVDALTGNIKLTNAGGCSPFLVKGETGNIEEIKVAGAPLGAFKHNRFIEIELQLEPGAAIVLYTDGIVEARNQSGEEIGFAGLKEILRKCRSDNAENFFNSIIGEYQKWLGGTQARDDLTLAILTRPVNILADQARD